MTKADILRMARESGFDEWVGTDDVRFIAVIERFATLISASERKKCARVCEQLTNPSQSLPKDNVQAWILGTFDCMHAIRARGKK